MRWPPTITEAFHAPSKLFCARAIGVAKRRESPTIRRRVKIISVSSADKMLSAWGVGGPIVSSAAQHLPAISPQCCLYSSLLHFINLDDSGWVQSDKVSTYLLLSSAFIACRRAFQHRIVASRFCRWPQVCLRGRDFKEPRRGRSPMALR